ncbi:MAG: hypothetical protein ACK56I_10980, partial [bacterium]
ANAEFAGDPGQHGLKVGTQQVDLGIGHRRAQRHLTVRSAAREGRIDRGLLSSSEWRDVVWIGSCVDSGRSGIDWGAKCAAPGHEEGVHRARHREALPSVVY